MLYYRFLWDYFIYFAILIGVNAISRFHGAPKKNSQLCADTFIRKYWGKTSSNTKFYIFKIIFLSGQFTVFPAIFGLFYTIKFFQTTMFLNFFFENAIICFQTF